MSNTLKVRRGTKANLPTLNSGEFGFTTDTNELFIGNGATNCQVLTSIFQSPSATINSTGESIVLTANEAQAFGDVCYIGSDGKAHIAKADAIANANAFVMCSDASIGSGNSGKYLVFGIARKDTWSWTVSGFLYLSISGTTGNTLTQTAPSGTNNIVQILGVALSSTTIFFNSCLVQIELT